MTKLVHFVIALIEHWSISFKIHPNNFAAEHSTRFKNNARVLHAMLQIQ